MRYYNLREDNGWQPDFDELEHMDLSKVKLLWTNYPNMPTGGDARKSTYERLVRFAQDHGIVVVNDNPYSLILNEHALSASDRRCQRLLHRAQLHVEELQHARMEGGLVRQQRHLHLVDTED